MKPNFEEDIEPKTRNIIENENKLELINKELEFKLKFFEDKNNKLIEEISKINSQQKQEQDWWYLKEAKQNAKLADVEKLKTDKRNLLKRCK